MKVIICFFRVTLKSILCLILNRVYSFIIKNTTGQDIPEHKWIRMESGSRLHSDFGVGETSWISWVNNNSEPRTDLYWSWACVNLSCVIYIRDRLSCSIPSVILANCEDRMPRCSSYPFSLSVSTAVSFRWL